MPEVQEREVQARAGALAAEGQDWAAVGWEESRTVGRAGVGAARAAQATAALGLEAWGWAAAGA